MRYHVVRSLAVAIVALVAAACGDNLDPPPVDADITDAGPEDASGDCDGASCGEPTCVDGIENGDETGLDCGGSCAPERRCGDGLGCAANDDCQSGVCTAQVCAAPACGDGVRQGNEACDDGNQTNGDGCDDGAGGTCRPTGCGNGVRSGKEECDDGNSTQGDGCDNNCTTTACGNGVITTGEVCDDDGTTDGDGCSATCQTEPGYTCSMVPSVCVGMCGDGVRVGTEACDDAPPAENGDGCNASCFVEPGWVCTGTPSLCFPICGDGRVVSGEMCDDMAPAENGDGCSATCTVETGYICSGSPSTCTPVCGDGLRLPGEACDDAAPAEDGDGCSATCTVEPGWTCTGAMQSTCSTTCGDGIRAGTEECDDAAPAENGDGCSATCTIEVGYTCAGTMPSLCAPICGDGLVRPGEGCDDLPPAEDGDGCSATCTVETGYVCTGEPSECAITCGDGDLDPGEACDDGRNDDDDGCSAACVIEFGWICEGTPSVCTSTCGDGLKSAQEECDDAPPAEDNDGCSATCTIETGFDCVGNAPSVCTTTCGDGVRGGAEQCDDGCGPGTPGVCDASDNGDGCTASCTLECGDGTFNPLLEQCEDGNRTPGDGCSATCTLEVTCAPGETLVQLVSTDIPKPIPDNNAAGIDSDLVVGTTGAVRKVVVGLGRINHTFDGDLDISLVSPSNRSRSLSARRGSTGDNFVNTRFDDAATATIASGSAPFTGAFRPDQTLSDGAGFHAQNTAGTWRLHVSDNANGDVGTILAWSLSLCVDPAAQCTNGVPDPGEECDDGNQTDTDACNNQCKVVDGCGDGNLDAGEQCDDDNTTAGDGCSATCQLEMTCAPGETPVIVTDFTSQAIADDNAFHDFPANVATSGGVSRAVVFLRTITHANDAHLDIQLASPGGGVIRRLSHDNSGTNYVQTVFEDAATSSIGSGSAPYSGRFRPEQSLSTTAFTDFRGMSAAGTWNLQVRDDTSGTTGTLDGWALGLCVDPTAAFCGDTIVGAGEECDDGNTNNADVCSNLCQLLEGCGDGNIDAGEACDDNNIASGDGCSSTCTLELTCGAGETPVVVTSTASTAIPDDQVFHDFPVTLPTAGAVRRVVVAIAGLSHPVTNQLDIQLRSPNGTVRDLSSDNGSSANLVQTVFDDTAGSTITSGSNPYTGRFRPEQSLSTTAGVDFRNGNAAGSWSLQIADDTAGMTGTLNTFTVAVCVDTAAAFCGNGVIDAGEECDDGNASNADACSGTCRVLDGCGDGNLDAGELCDDDNTASGDGCSATCQPDITCGAGETPVIVTNNGSAPITDDQVVNIFPVTVAEMGAVRRATVLVTGIAHAQTGHLDIGLAGPTGVVRNLSDDNGGSNANYIQTAFDDTASSTITSGSAPFSGRFRPEQSLSNSLTADFLGTRADGTWELRITDDTAGVQGMFGSWTLALCVAPGASCGNGVVDTNEECDDGNTNNNDNCSNACAIADGCGDGNLDAGEECDDGGATPGDGCSGTCTLDIACAPGEMPVVIRNTTSVSIPDASNGGVLSTPIVVPVAGVVRRVIASVNITHTQDDHIDLWLMSPYGVQRNLSDENGGSNDDYRATIFSDSATTTIGSGSAPYTGTFRPEQSLSDAAGFGNQSAGGSWRLRVADDASGQTGTLDSWSVALCVDTSVASVCGNGYAEANETCDDGNTTANDGCSSTCQLELTCGEGQTPVVMRTSADLVIPDNNTATGVSSTIEVVQTGTVRKAVVELVNITHTFSGDVDATLASPAGPALDITSDNSGGDDDFVSLILDDAATTLVSSGVAPFRGRFRPEALLAGFDGQAAAGTWTLRVVDDANSDTGVFRSWALGLCVE